jgi:hypothetical protein
MNATYFKFSTTHSALPLQTPMKPVLVGHMYAHFTHLHAAGNDQHTECSLAGRVQVQAFL